MNAVEEVTLKINGRKWGGWTDQRIAAGIERVARDFDVVITRRWPGAPEISDMRLMIKKGDLVEVLIGNDHVMTGYIDSIPFSYDANSVSISIRGRSRTADLVDCSAEVRQFMRQTPRQIISVLAKPFGVSVLSEIECSELSDFSVDFGETVMDSIDRILGLQQMLAFDDANGDLVLGKIGTRAATTALVLGENIKSANCANDDKDRYSDYTVSGQRAGSDDDFSEVTNSKINAHYKDKEIRRHRPMLIKQSGQSSLKTCSELCQFEAVRRKAKAEEITYEVVGWRQGNGELWQPNMMVIVYDPIAGIYNEHRVIAEVEYIKNRNDGTICRLRVGPKEAYLPEPNQPEKAKKRRSDDEEDF